MFVGDCHLLPQTDYIYDKGDSRTCDHVLRLESLGSDFDELMEQYGLPARIGAFDQHNPGACSSLTRKDLTEETLQLLGSVYADDFRLLNYTVP